MIIYMIMIIYFMFIEIQLLFHLKWKYFHRFWSFIELGIIICSWTSVAIYIWRYRECKRIGKLFQQTNGYVYINLQLASYINNILTFLYGFCCFFGTIKFLYLCRFNQRLDLFIQTLQYAGKELISFGFMFSIVFMSFVSLFYLLFNSNIWSCSTLLQTSQMLFEMILMKFDASDLIDAAPFLGPFSFSLFILLVVFVCMSMFISIINNSFRRARENLNDNDQEIFSFMMKKFQRWTGIRIKFN
jgi:Polycystin cation channel